MSFRPREQLLTICIKLEFVLAAPISREEKTTCCHCIILEQSLLQIICHKIYISEHVYTYEIRCHILGQIILYLSIYLCISIYTTILYNVNVPNLTNPS